MTDRMAAGATQFTIEARFITAFQAVVVPFGPTLILGHRDTALCAR